MPEVKSKPRLHASHIDPRAYDIVDRLQKKGFVTYLVGGCVRDLLLNIEPKDFDITTNALPETIKRSIPGSYIIGKRFKLVLAKRGNDQFEIATFRREASKEELNQSNEEVSFIFNDNFFGSPEQDALRRDFTVNALFYDPITNDLIDYVNAQKDLEHRLIRMIGDPDRRLLEDPIRSLRAVRLAHKIGFTIEANLRASILKHSPPVALTALPRRREEFLKILKLDQPSRAFFELYDLGLIEVCLPSLMPMFESAEGRMLLSHYLECFFKEQIKIAPNPIHLVAPLVLAMLHFSNNQDWDKIENFLKNEFGAFKSEMTILQAALLGRYSLPKIESFKKRSQKRKKGFIGNPWFYIQYAALTYDYDLSAKQRLFWEREIELAMQSFETRSGSLKSEGQFDQDREHDQHRLAE
jgi:poly(A) polymerase